MNDQQLDEFLEILCPPGNGVYTVNTAKERKEGLHQKYYKQIEANEVQKTWAKGLKQIPNAPLLLGLCSDCGGGILRGANWGPLFIRSEILKRDHPSYFDLGDVRVIPHLLDDKYLNESTIKNCRKALYKDENRSLPVSPLSLGYKAAQIIGEAYPKLPLIGLGGDHSVSYPLVKAYLERKKREGVKAGVFHFDAHTDLMVERLGIDLCFGSWAYHILPLLPDPSTLVQVGIRSSAKDKNYWEGLYGVTQIWSQEVLQSELQEITDKILEVYKKAGIQELYLSFDIDAIDSDIVAATGTPEPKGLLPHHAITLIKNISKEIPITGADLVEVAPFLNTNIDSPLKEPHSTLSTAADILQVTLEGVLCPF